MTNLEAIEELKYQEVMRSNGSDYQVNNLVIGAAISALEKQIPKKVNNRTLIVLSFPAHIRGDCPVCGSRYLTSADTNYCNVCGQKLDFGKSQTKKHLNY